MYRKILITGVTTAAIVGAGGTALALSGSDTTNGTAAGSSTSSTGASGTSGKHKSGDKQGKGRLLKRLEHAQIVTSGKDGGASVTHDLITGTVTSVSATSITVQAADKTSETFSVSKTTMVRQRTAGSKTGTASTIAKIAKGDHVLVAGTGTSNYAAGHIIELVK